MSYPINLVTGSYGRDHVTSADDGALFAAIMGNGQYVVSGFEHEVVNNNTIRIKSGSILMNGRHIKINNGASVNVAIENGSTGMNRTDLIVITYENNGGVESAAIEVLKGNASSGIPVTPTYQAGNILNDDTFVQMPMLKVNIQGINISSVDKLYSRTNPIQELYNMIIPPVGYIELNETGVNPSNRYPGTVWQLVGKGAVAACVDSTDNALKNAGAIVGANSKFITTDNLPEHKHYIGYHTHDIGNHVHNVKDTVVAEYGYHQHVGSRAKKFASGSGAYALVPEGTDGSAYTSDPITRKPSAAAVIANTGQHFHNVNIDIDSANPKAGGKTGNPAAQTLTGNNDTSEIAFDTMQKTYLCYRWKRIS